MTLHRRRQPYSAKYAERQLTQARARLAALEPLPPGSRWQQRADRARLYASLEAQVRKWERVLEPERIETYAF